MLRTIIGAAAAIAAFGLSPARAQQCPIGAMPSVDAYGNQVCKRIDNGKTVSTQTPRGQACPNGAYPTVDNFGNRICRSEAAGGRPRTDYYDTSKGCPIGTIPWVDTYGNQVCKRP